MGARLANPEEILDSAVAAIANDAGWRSLLDELPVPVYTTDADGAVTYWNRACVEFAGREPQLGQDRWCVTWKIYTTTGEFMPHEECPMADAVRTRESNRGKVAIAMRPDGSRRAFRPYPTPLVDATGRFTGAINLLLDVTEEQAGALRDQAERCRRLAQALFNRESQATLADMAERFERTAVQLEQER